MGILNPAAQPKASWLAGIAEQYVRSKIIGSQHESVGCAGAESRARHHSSPSDSPDSGVFPSCVYWSRVFCPTVPLFFDDDPLSLGAPRVSPRSTVQLF
jgi:hypothetical protein